MVDVPLRCSPATIDLILDTDHRVLAAVGAARSQKTHTGVYWALRQWGLRGGDGVTGWFLGPELDRAFVLVEKFCDGEGDNPAICPAVLIESRPHSKKEPDPVIVMIDGTRIAIKHTSRQGRNLTARGIAFGLWTEAATTHSPMDFVRLRGRIVQSRGQLYMDAVPESRNWVKTAVLDAAVAEAEEAAAAKSEGVPYDATYRVVQLSSRGNPWVDEVEADAFMRDLKRIDGRIAAREAGGEWMNDRDLLYAFDESRISFDPIERDPFEFLGLTDITEQASLRWFHKSHKWIIAGDINARPHTSLMGKIGIKRDADSRDPRNWIAVFLDCLQVEGLDSEQAAAELVKYRNRAYEGAGFIMDATATIDRHNSGGALNSRKQIKPREAFEAAGFEVRGPAMQTKQTWLYRNPELIDSAIVTRRVLRDGMVRIDKRRCQPFINALRNQEAEQDGITPLKKSNTNQDRYIAAYTDVFRYWIWPFFDLRPHETSGAKLAVVEYG